MSNLVATLCSVTFAWQLAHRGAGVVQNCSLLCANWQCVQEVWYQLSFEGYPESEAEWFPAARIRSEHPHGEQLIAAFDRGLEASGQGDVALPPHAEERAAALSFGTTPQVSPGAHGFVQHQ